MLWRTAFRGFPWRVMFVRMGKGRVELTIPCRKGLGPCRITGFSVDCPCDDSASFGGCGVSGVAALYKSGRPD